MKLLMLLTREGAWGTWNYRGYQQVSLSVYVASIVRPLPIAQIADELRPPLDRQGRRGGQNK